MELELPVLLMLGGVALAAGFIDTLAGGGARLIRSLIVVLRLLMLGRYLLR